MFRGIIDLKRAKARGRKIQIRRIAISKAFEEIRFSDGRKMR